MKIAYTFYVMNNFFIQAKKLQPNLRSARRFLHRHAEVGFDLHQTTDFIKKQLKEMKISVKNCGKGSLLATLGRKKGKTVLLRADMDALPIQEEIKKPFACKTGAMHACGHDFHATMLLGAAKLLKRKERELDGQILLLFQAAEENLQGAKDVLSTGILTDEKLNAAIALHVMTATPFPCGTLVLPTDGVGAPAADFFTLKVQGKGCHGSTPHKGVDALAIAYQIFSCLQSLSARVLPSGENAVLTVGKFFAGETPNAIPDTALLQGTLRTFDEELRLHVKQRLLEIAENIPKTFHGTGTLTFDSGCPSLLNNGILAKELFEILQNGYKTENVIDAATFGRTEKGSGSEDFAYISREIPSVLIAIAAGSQQDGYQYPLHHPKTDFDERALSIGAATYATCAYELLCSTKKRRKKDNRLKHDA